jgi:hypothetical protein
MRGSKSHGFTAPMAVMGTRVNVVLLFLAGLQAALAVPICVFPAPGFASCTVGGTSASATGERWQPVRHANASALGPCCSLLLQAMMWSCSGSLLQHWAG